MKPVRAVLRINEAKTIFEDLSPPRLRLYPPPVTLPVENEGVNDCVGL